MITLRKAAERGHAEHGWLDSWHSFSFADYHDPAHMGVGNLRVLNEDRIAPGSGFGTHGHRDMEIVSVVLEGALAHKDSIAAASTPAASAAEGLGSAPARPGDRAGDGAVAGDRAGVLRPGDVQRMSAGSGVLHSEFNHSHDRTTHFLQIWILPRHRGIGPGYAQKFFDPAARRGVLTPLVTPDGRDGSLTMNADASISGALLDGDARIEQPLDRTRLAYVHVARGRVRANGMALAAGDAVTLRDEGKLVLDEGQGAEVLVFDLAPGAM